MQQTEWNEAWEVEVERAMRDGLPLTLALLESAGGTAGEVADLVGWQRHLRVVDLVAQLDSGRVAIALHNCELPAAVQVVERLRTAIGREGLSAGVAQWDHVEDGTTVLRRAERALAGAQRQPGSAIVGSTS